MKKGQLINLLSCLLLAIQPAIAFSQLVGIGTTTPAFKLDVRAGSINTDSVYRIQGNTVFSIQGTGNTFIGKGSGNFNSSGNYNSVLGFEALYNNVSGGYNTAQGYRTLYLNTTGYANTALGHRALYSNTTGYYNTAVGESALDNNTVGAENTAVGEAAMISNTTGTSNTAVGTRSFFYNTSGVKNTGVGVESLHFNMTGEQNTAYGYRAMPNITSGNYNTVAGSEAMVSSFVSSYSAVFGYRAGTDHSLGFNNTLLGAEAEIAFSNQYNSIAIGNLSICPDNSTVRIGNSANWSYGGYANWTNISDGRFKKNIREEVTGLDFIMRLRPVNYQLAVLALSEKLNESKRRQDDESMQRAYAEKEKMIWTGFIAQEVEEAARQSNFNFSGVDKPRNENGIYGLRYAEFVVPLVKGMQEQQEIITELRRQNEELRKRMERLEELIGGK
jgi:trimeric autotransporter adhesin